MSDRKACWFMIDKDLADRLQGAKARSGLSVSEQIRLAVRDWLDRKEWEVAHRDPRAPVDDA